MKLRNILIVVVLFLLILLPSCKKDGHAILTITIQNSVVDYTFWSISYDVRMKEITGNDCKIFQDVLTIVDNNGAIAYSRTYEMNTELPGCAATIESYSGLLIGPYALSLYPKPVVLRHTIHYSDSVSGDIYTASGDLVIHE